MDIVTGVITLAVFVGFLYYLSRAIGYNSAQAAKERGYVLATSFAIALLIIAVAGVAIAYTVSGSPNKNSEIPLAILPIVFLIPASLVVFGLAQVAYSDAASALYERRRETGGISKWIIPSVPKRESFILRGWVIAATGAFFLLIFIFGAYTDATSGYLH